MAGPTRAAVNGALKVLGALTRKHLAELERMAEPERARWIAEVVVERAREAARIAEQLATARPSGDEYRQALEDVWKSFVLGTLGPPGARCFEGHEGASIPRVFYPAPASATGRGARRSPARRRGATRRTKRR